MAKRTPARRPAPAPAKRPAPAPAPAKRRPAPKRRPAAPRRGTNISAPAIAAEGRNLAADNVGFINQNLPATANNFSNIQQGQIDAQAARLDNAYTQDARAQVNQSFTGADQLGNMGMRTAEMGDAAGQQISSLAPLAQQQAGFAAGNIYGLGGMLANEAQQGFANAGPTSIEQSLYNQGQADLALGRSLSAEETRDATQSARQGMAARGMATGMGALGAELLNRDRFANQRLNQRRSFAAEANNLRENNVMARRAAAGNMATASGNLFDAGGRINVLGTQTAGDLMATGNQAAMQGRQVGGALLGEAARVRQSGAGMLANLDPYSRAMSAGINMGQFSSGAAGNMLGGQLGGMIDLSGNAATFNTNRQDSLYNNYQNNQAAIRSANMQAGASNNSGMMGMIGGIGGGALMGVGLAL
jgi:hypothetical protein